jgi:type IV pilus assembly protein PilC
MRIFKVKGMRGTGERYEGLVSAEDKLGLYEQLKKDNIKLISAIEAKEGVLSQLWKQINGIFSTIPMHEKIIFARNLSAMLTAGLALSRALTIISHQSHNARFKEVVLSLEETIRKGGTLSQALSNYTAIFSPLFVSMVKAGEESGGLADALLVVGNQMEKSYLLIKKVRGALIYPAIIVLAMLTIGVLMLIYVVPTLTSTFKELKVELPLATRIVIAVSDFLKNDTLLFLAGVVLFVGGVIAFGRTEVGKKMFDFISIRIPIIGTIVQETYAARTARTIASLLSAGVPVIESLKITEDVLANGYYKSVLAEAQKKVEKGAPMSEAFLAHENLYPILVGEMMTVGEETGETSGMLQKLAVFYEDEVEQKTKDMSTIIEPFLMIFIGVTVGFFALAMISPTYSLMNNI